VFKLGLPSLSPGENWYELAPYDRGEASSFLQGGGRELSAEALDALFAGLDRIEEARGLYRPITLNMIGLVLESMGRTLRGDPSKLIQAYLTDSLTATSRDFARPLLAEMITEAGTKEPHSETDLADRTQFEPWQVKATLADLARRGLVRRLEGAESMWEIAHDFVARTIGQLIGRLKPTLIERVRPLVAPTMLVGWVVVFAITLPLLSARQLQVDRSRAEFLAELGTTELQRGNLDGALRLGVHAARLDLRLGKNALTASRASATLAVVVSRSDWRLLLGGDENAVNSAAFSPDGARIVTASGDNTARIWDAASGKEIAVLRGHEHGLASAAFSPYGARIVTASLDNTARIWDAHFATMSAKELLTEVCTRRLQGFATLSRDEMRLANYPDSTPKIDVCEGVN
jgi:WD domain, G-beta repeat